MRVERFTHQAWRAAAFCVSIIFAVPPVMAEHAPPLPEPYASYYRNIFIPAVQERHHAVTNDEFKLPIYVITRNAQLIYQGTTETIDFLMASHQAPIYYRDKNGNGRWDADELVWADKGSGDALSVFNLDADTVVSGAPAAADNGAWGKRNGISFGDLNGDGQWAENEPVWQGGSYVISELAHVECVISSLIPQYYNHLANGGGPEGLNNLPAWSIQSMYEQLGDLANAPLNSLKDVPKWFEKQVAILRLLRWPKSKHAASEWTYEASAQGGWASCFKNKSYWSNASISFHSFYLGNGWSIGGSHTAGYYTNDERYYVTTINEPLPYDKPMEQLPDYLGLGDYCFGDLSTDTPGWSSSSGSFSCYSNLQKTATRNPCRNGGNTQEGVFSKGSQIQCAMSTIAIANFMPVIVDFDVYLVYSSIGAGRNETNYEEDAQHVLDESYQYAPSPAAGKECGKLNLLFSTSLQPGGTAEQDIFPEYAAGQVPPSPPTSPYETGWRDYWSICHETGIAGVSGYAVVVAKPQFGANGGGGGGGGGGSCTIPSPPTTPIKDTVEKLAEHLDVNRDDLVDIGVGLHTAGSDTGTATFDFERENPQIIIPVAADPFSNLPIHAYIAQGAFPGTGNSYWTHPDADGDGLPFAFSLHTRVFTVEFTNKTDAHVKKVAVVRPRGNITVFEFDWFPETSTFREFGHPCGVNAGRTYVLRDMTPANHTDLRYDLAFESGIVHSFSEWLVSVSNPAGLTTNAPAALGVDRLIMTNAISSPLYDVTLSWRKGRVESFHYAYKFKSTLSADCALSYGVDGGIAAVAKTKFPESAITTLAQNEFTLGNGVNVKKEGTCITMRIPGAGELLTTFSLNNNKLLERMTITHGSHSATTTYARSTASGRHPLNHAPRWSSVESITHPDGLLESFEYAPDTGWLTRRVVPYGQNLYMVTSYSYDKTLSEGEAADPKRIVERPRRSVRGVAADPQNDGAPVSAEFHSYSGLVTTTRRASSSSATWGDANNLETKTTIAPYGPPSVVMPAGSFTNTATSGADATLTVTATSPGAVMTTVVSPLGDIISSTSSFEKICVGKSVAELDDFGRIKARTNLDGSQELYEYPEIGEHFAFLPSKQTLTKEGRALREATYKQRDPYGRPTVVEDGRGTNSFTYDASGNTTARIHTPKGGIPVVESSTYDALNRLVERCDMYGSTSIQYHGCPNARTISWPDGKIEEVVTNPDGSVREVIRELNPVKYEYGFEEGKGLCTRAVTPVSQGVETASTSYSDFLGRVWLTENSNGYWSKSFFDKAGRVVATSDSSGRLSETLYDTMGRVTSSTVNGLLTTYAYATAADAPRGRAYRETTTTMHADTGNRVVVQKHYLDGQDSAETVNGRTTTYSRQLLGGDLFKNEIKRPDGSVFTTSALSNPLEVTENAPGYRSTTYFDPNGRGKRLCDSAGADVSCLHEGATSRVKQVAAKDGSWATYEHERGSDNVKALKANGGTNIAITRGHTQAGGEMVELSGEGDAVFPVTSTQNVQGGVASLETVGKPGKAKTQWVRTPALNRNEKIINGSSAYAAFAHPDGRPNSINRQLSANDSLTKTFTYTAPPQLFPAGWRHTATGSAVAAPNVVLASHTSHGDPRSITVEGVCAYAVDYDSERRVGAVAFTPAPAVPAAPAQAEYHYDQLTRVRSGAKLGTENISYQYDEAGRITSIVSGPISVTYAYRPGSVRDIDSTVITADGKAILTRNIEREPSTLRISEITHLGTDGTPLGAFSYEHFPDSGKTKKTTITDVCGKSLEWEFLYDKRGQLSSAVRSTTNDNGPLASYRYDADSIANVLMMGKVRADGSSSTSTPDLFNRMAVRKIGSTLEVCGSAAPNAAVAVNDIPAARNGELFTATIPVQNTDSAVTAELTVSAAKYDLTAAPDAGGLNPGNEAGADVVQEMSLSLPVPQAVETPSYDQAGRLLENSIWKYSWDSDDRLIGIESKIPVRNGKLLKIQNYYDHAGRRVCKQVYSAPDTNHWTLITEHSFYYDTVLLDGSPADFGLLTAETITTYPLNLPPTTLNLSYVWGLDLNGSYQGQGGVGGLCAIVDKTTSKTYIPAMDSQGTIHALIDAADGSTAAEYDYDPYGRLINATGPFASQNPFRFQSKYLDPETSLYYFGFRYYDPSTCRWLCADPMEEEGGLNLYAFCGNDPVNRVEYLGLALYAFDGTGNNKNKLSNYTNISKLANAYTDGQAFYLPGVGSGGFFDRIWGGITGDGGKDIVDEMYEKVVQEYNSGDPNIDIIGFSRGASLARALANKIAKEGIKVNYESYQKYYSQGELITPERVYPKIRFLGLFDSVASFGIPGNDINIGYDLSIPWNVGFTAHSVADNEYRGTFPLHSIYAIDEPIDLKRKIEKRFLGCHSDNGASYNLITASIPSLFWMADMGNSVSKGQMFDYKKLGGVENAIYKRWKSGAINMKDYIHDSRLNEATNKPMLMYMKDWLFPSARQIYYPQF